MFDIIMDERLPKGGPEAYDKFCVALACNRYSYVAAKLKIAEGK